MLSEAGTPEGTAKRLYNASHQHGPQETRNKDPSQRNECMSLALQLNGYRLTTAEILYHMPDHPGLLQSFVWQEYDIAPDYPALDKFLAFWKRELEGPLHSVRVATTELVRASDWRNARFLRHLH